MLRKNLVCNCINCDKLVDHLPKVILKTDLEVSNQLYAYHYSRLLAFGSQMCCVTGIHVCKRCSFLSSKKVILFPVEWIEKASKKHAAMYEQPANQSTLYTKNALL